VRVVNIDPRRGTTRRDGFVAIQEAFVDHEYRIVSERYDFDDVRVGIQPFISDFRGFLFQDQPVGVRFFGTRDNNQWQYNVGWFRRLEKDTNSGLNDITRTPRHDDVFVGNLYRQDFMVPGFTLQGTVVYNRNHETAQQFLDDNGFQVRPAVMGDARPRTYDVVYLGANGDGHFGRWNTTASLYWAIGRDDHNQISQRSANVNAFFAAAEVSRDFDWLRVRGSLLYASGDKDPYDGKENGFDAILENPQFAGADTSFWIRQAVPLIGGGGVALSGRNAVLPALRSSKDQGQSNFTNPGLVLVGIGVDADLAPRWRAIANVNQLWFNNTSSLSALRNQGDIDKGLGTDVSVAVQYRPLFIQNIVFNSIGGRADPGQGIQAALCGRRQQYAVLDPRQPGPDLLMVRTMRDRPSSNCIRHGHALFAVRRWVGITAALLLTAVAALTFANTEEEPVARTYVVAPPAPERQTSADVIRKSEGCVSCHTASDNPSMHKNPAVLLGCVDCHGGDATRSKPKHASPNEPAYVSARDAAHVLPRYPNAWKFPSSANPQHSYTLLNRESREFVRFVNPGDYRVARESCGACHLPTIQAAERSLMATSAMLWGGASYNNGILPFKRYLLGEAYTDKGEPARLAAPVKPNEFMKHKGIPRGALSAARRGKRYRRATSSACSSAAAASLGASFPEIGIPNNTGLIQRLDEPGRPDIRQSNRGPGHGLADRRARHQHH
jgi:hypothetical protein